MGAGTDSSPGRLSGITTKALSFGIGWVARNIYRKTAVGEQHSGWLEKKTLEYNDNHERFNKYLVRVVVGYTCLDLNMDLVGEMEGICFLAGAQRDDGHGQL